MFKLSDPANNKFDIWLKANGVYLAIGTAALLVIVLVVLLILSKRKKAYKTEQVENELKKDGNILEFVGGKDNIVSVSKVGSRISLELNDFSLLKEDDLKQAGVLSFIKMSKKITLVCNKSDVDSIFNSLN